MPSGDPVVGTAPGVTCAGVACVAVTCVGVACAGVACAGVACAGVTRAVDTAAASRVPRRGHPDPALRFFQVRNNRVVF